MARSAAWDFAALLARALAGSLSALDIAAGLEAGCFLFALAIAPIVFHNDKRRSLWARPFSLHDFLVRVKSAQVERHGYFVSPGCQRSILPQIRIGESAGLRS